MTCWYLTENQTGLKRKVVLPQHYRGLICPLFPDSLLRKAIKAFLLENCLKFRGHCSIRGDFGPFIFYLKIGHTFLDILTPNKSGLFCFLYWNTNPFSHNFTWCHLQWDSSGSCPSDATKRTCWRGEGWRMNMLKDEDGDKFVLV